MAILPPSCANLSGHMGDSWNPQGLSRPVRGLLYFLSVFKCLWTGELVFLGRSFSAVSHSRTFNAVWLNVICLLNLVVISVRSFAKLIVFISNSSENRIVQVYILFPRLVSAVYCSCPYDLKDIPLLKVMIRSYFDFRRLYFYWISCSEGNVIVFRLFS
jgi:hypothetical protein